MQMLIALSRLLIADSFISNLLIAVALTKIAFTRTIIALTVTATMSNYNKKVSAWIFGSKKGPQWTG